MNSQLAEHSSYGTLVQTKPMDVNALLSQLRSEREMLEEAILALERLARGGGKRRGRPPRWMTDLKIEPEGVEPAAPKRKIRVLNEEARKRMSEAQRKRWAAKRGTEPTE